MLAGNNIYHFISNRSLLLKDFPIRVYPVGPVQITFSNSKDQTNHTVQILMEKSGISPSPLYPGIRTCQEWYSSCPSEMKSHKFEWIILEWQILKN